MRTFFACRCAAALVVVTGLSFSGTGPQDSPAKPARFDTLGDPLPDGAVARLGTLRMRLTGTATGLAVSPDGKIIAAAGPGDQTIKLWDTTTGKEIWRLQVDPNRWAVALAFSPDGKWLAVGSSIGGAGYQPPPPSQLLLWDVESGKLLREMNGPVAASVLSVVFADTGKTLVSAAADGTVRWWEAATGKLLKTWDPFAKQRPAGAFTCTAETTFYKATLASGGMLLQSRCWAGSIPRHKTRKKRWYGIWALPSKSWKRPT